MANNLKYIICGKLYNGIEPEFKEGWKILVEGNKIVEVGPNVEQPDSAEVIDLSVYQVTPGMIDAHMHMDYFDWHEIRDMVYTTTEEYKALAMLHTAQKTLSRGFTTVRHLGGITTSNYSAVDVKRVINEGKFSGSRLIVAPRLLGTIGGHGDLTQAFAHNPEFSKVALTTRPSIGAGKDFFSNAVREEIKAGADFIKIMATGGFFTPYDNPMQQQMTDEELKAVFDEAHNWGKTVTAHVYSAPLQQKLVKLGIDGMEHCSLMDEETAEMIVENNVYVVPTFTPYEDAVHYDPVSIQTKQPEYRAKLEIYKDALQKGREVIKNSKVKLGYGTDMVATHNNCESGYEYVAWMKSGMGAFRTLEAATRVNAEICQVDDIVGTIEVGKLADISAWGRDLMTDETALLDCAFVMKDGVVYETEKCADLED